MLKTIVNIIPTVTLVFENNRLYKLKSKRDIAERIIEKKANP
jgi:hypothetical protein